MKIDIQNRPVIRMTQGEKNNNPLTTNCEKHEWLVASKFQEMGSHRKREATKTFASQEDARAFFDEKVAMFCKMLERTPNASIKQSNNELLIYVGDVQIVNMTYLADPRQCA